MPRQSALPIAYSLWGEAPPSVYSNAYAIIGSGYPTPLQINDNDHNGCAQSLAANGDNTVLLSSARGATWIPPGNVRYVNEEHVGLPSNIGVIGAVLRIMKGLPPDKLSFSAFGSTSSTASACSPADLGLQNVAGEIVAAGFSQIAGGQYTNNSGAPEVLAPSGSYTSRMSATGTGVVTLILRQTGGDGNVLQTTIFHDIPVGPRSTGTVAMSESAFEALELAV